MLSAGLLDGWWTVAVAVLSSVAVVTSLLELNLWQYVPVLDFNDGTNGSCSKSPSVEIDAVSRSTHVCLTDGT